MTPFNIGWSFIQRLTVLFICVYRVVGDYDVTIHLNGNSTCWDLPIAFLGQDSLWLFLDLCPCLPDSHKINSFCQIIVTHMLKLKVLSIQWEELITACRFCLPIRVECSVCCRAWAWWLMQTQTRLDADIINGPFLHLHCLPHFFCWQKIYTCQVC